MSFDIRDLVRIAKSVGFTFTLNGKLMKPEEVFSESGMLPGITRRADQLSSLCLGYGLGATFEEAQGTPLGVKVIFDDTTPNVLRYLCLVDVLFEMAKGSASSREVSLDELMYD